MATREGEIGEMEGIETEPSERYAKKRRIDGTEIEDGGSQGGRVEGDVEGREIGERGADREVKVKQEEQEEQEGQEEEERGGEETQRSSTSAVTAEAQFGTGSSRGDTRVVVIVYGTGQEKIVSMFADVLGKPYRLKNKFRDVTTADQGLVVGVAAAQAKADISTRDRRVVVAINTHNCHVGTTTDEFLSAQCDFEYFYSETPLLRRDMARFTSFVLGQINHHEALMAKPKTSFISTTFPDLQPAQTDLVILAVGADAVEIRVDLLQEPQRDGSFSAVPSLGYVGVQVMLLRQRTELPLIFTTRCMRENGRFPMDRPDLYYEYLYRAVQWGVEYIDVEVWLPEAIRRRLFEQRGSSRIMSAFHDFSTNFKWPSVQAQAVFLESRKYADIVKMIAVVNHPDENFELEYFRSRIRAEYPDAPPLSMVNMGDCGHFSRILNKVFTPITHPLLPIIAAPGQMSAAEINAALTVLGHLPKKSIYGISPSPSGDPRHTPFFVKIFNELGLPHTFALVPRRGTASGGVEGWCNQQAFGGAYLDPPVPFSTLMSNSTFFARLRDDNGNTGPPRLRLSEAAQATGMVDTIVVRMGAGPAVTQWPPAAIPSQPRPPPRRSATSLLSLTGADFDPDILSGRDREATALFLDNSVLLPGPDPGLPPHAALLLDNATWRGTWATLTCDVAPSAYAGRSALVLGTGIADVASAVFALRALGVTRLYTVGFETPPALARGLVVTPCRTLEDLRRTRRPGGAEGSEGDDDDGAGPFVVVSAFGPENSGAVVELLQVLAERGSPAASSSSQSSEGGGSQAGESPPEAGEVQPGQSASSSLPSPPEGAGPQSHSQSRSSALLQHQPRRVFLDLVAEPRGVLGGGRTGGPFGGAGGAGFGRSRDLEAMAEKCGFSAYGAADVAAFTTVETLRLLVNQNVPYSFVRQVGGTGWF